MSRRTSAPISRNAAGSEPLTSASPPVLIKGNASELTNRMRNEWAFNIVYVLPVANEGESVTAVNHTGALYVNQA